ncbi:MAG TPA: alpha/beta fold hydrolase [Streptosporangiaceae bacterium]|nr:alpha/beta fold hydrolase [Streptosporangiaceae bacterium]
MTKSVPYARTIVTEDGVPIDAAHLPGDTDLGIVLAHGFTLNWQRPAVWRVATVLNEFGGVVTFDFRGHGRSGGVSTVGDKEIKDVDVAVGYARELGYRRIATVGFSMGASIVLRHAGLIGDVDAVVSVSSPGQWYYRGTRPMRLVHLAVGNRTGRLVTKAVLKTRISNGKWDPVPLPPADAAALIAPTPLLIVHGDKDEYFPVDHARRLYDAAREPKELWIIPGFGHAETGAGPQHVRRIGAWIRGAVGLAAAGTVAEGDQPDVGESDVPGPVAAAPNQVA